MPSLTDYDDDHNNSILSVIIDKVLANHYFTHFLYYRLKVWLLVILFLNKYFRLFTFKTVETLTKTL